MKGRKLKSSERILLIVLACVFIFTGYIAFPLRKHLRAMEYAKGNKDLAYDELEGIREPKEPIPNIDRLSDELAALIKEREALEKRLEARGGDLYSTEAPGLLEELNLRIANLASENGIWVRENAPISLSKSQEYLQRHRRKRSEKDVESIPLLPEDIKDRPFRKLEMVATYPGFKEFIDTFCTLSLRLVIAGFSIETDPREASMPRPPLLKIELIWVLI